MVSLLLFFFLAFFSKNDHRIVITLKMHLINVTLQDWATKNEAHLRTRAWS